MKHIGIILGLCMVWGVLAASQSAWAHSSHEGIHVPSQMDLQKDHKLLHCKQLIHHPRKTKPFCPHSLYHRSKQTQLLPDCGDTGGQAPGQSQGFKIYSLSLSIEKPWEDDPNSIFMTTKFLLPFPVPDPLEQPPQKV